jgi:hypothetical protein
LVGPAERHELQISDRFLSRYPKVAMTKGCALYRVTAK